MSRWRGRSLLWLGALLAFSASAAASASAASLVDAPAAIPPPLRPLIASRVHPAATGHHHPAWISRFNLMAKGGYRVTVVASRGVVALEVTKTRGSSAKAARAKASPRQGAIAAYVAHGVVKPNRIKASFGRFGRVSVRFHPSRRIVKSRPGRHCAGPHRYTIRHGVFVGSIHFTGEDRYLRVRAKRAKGQTRRPPHLRCASGYAPRATVSHAVGHAPPVARGVLEAGWREPLAATELFALRSGKRVLYLASTEESLGALAVVRYAFALAPAKTFVQDEALTEARLTPPWPFSGTGRYTAAPDGTRAWTGGLRAAFPGAPTGLTGPEFRVRLESGA